MRRLRNIAMGDNQESVTTGYTDRHKYRQADGRRQSDPYVPLCFADAQVKKEETWLSPMTKAPTLTEQAQKTSHKSHAIYF